MRLGASSAELWLLNYPIDNRKQMLIFRGGCMFPNCSLSGEVGIKFCLIELNDGALTHNDDRSDRFLEW